MVLSGLMFITLFIEIMNPVQVIIISMIISILLCSLFWWIIYKIRLRSINSELIIKEKNLSETKEEYQATLYRIQKINSDLVTAKERAEEADKLKTAFLTNMSHEIRTPMNAIVGMASFLTEPGLSKEEAEDYVEIINSSCKQLLTVINDIVDISKIEAGQVQIVSEQVNINKLMRELYVIYNKQIDLDNISLSYSCELPDDLAVSWTDESRLKQILFNLLSNAFKFTEKGKVEFGYTIKEEFLEFFVKDSGTGISAENIESIFDRFWQAGKPNSRQIGGIGLGLSISKELVEKMGGSLRAASRPGEGSAFYFTIPYMPYDQTIDSHEEVIRDDSAKNWENKTILIVEDNQQSFTYINKILKDTNIKILHAWNGVEAQELLKIHPEISIVLMDFKMPVMDGYEATRLIKKSRPELPVIAQTAYAFDDDRAKIINAGCVDFFSKPFNKEILLEVVDKYLEQKK
jgi:signal transduction histidine kinase/ActR/RegA family two-component response regulator